MVGGEGGVGGTPGHSCAHVPPRLRPPPPIVRRRTELSKLRGPIEHAGVIYVCEHHESYITLVPGLAACNRHPGSPAQGPPELL